MAGLAESCSHVGSLLFAIEAAVKIRNSATVTQTKAYWLLPSGINKVEYAEVNDINFTSMKTRKKQMDKCFVNGEHVSPSSNKPAVHAAPPASFFFGVHSWLVKVLGQFSIIYFRGLGLRIGVRLWVSVRVGVRVWVRVRVRVRVMVSVVLWSEKV